MDSTFPLSGERTANTPPSYGRRGAGDLLDQVFSLYRRGFPTFFVVTAVLLIPIALLALIQRQYAETAVGITLGMLNGALSLVYGVVAPAATCLVATALLRGQRLSPGAAYRQVRGRFWALVRLGLLKYAILWLALIVAGIAFIPLILASMAVGGWVIFLGMGAMAVAGVFLYLRWSLAETALLFETDLNARGSLGRSVDLLDGSMRRVVLVLGAISLITIVLNTVVQVTGYALTGELRALVDAANNGQLQGALAGLAKSQGLRTDVVLSLFSTTGSLLMAPLAGIAQAVLYTTQRSELEGADLLAEVEAVNEAS
jgi:hypothetical protein